MKISRLAFGKPHVYLSPNWTLELLIALVAVMFLALLATLGEMAIAVEKAAQAEAASELWREFALAPETQPVVRIEPDGAGFKCSNFNVRREWERAVASKCQELGGLLIQARATR